MPVAYGTTRKSISVCTKFPPTAQVKCRNCRNNTHPLSNAPEGFTFLTHNTKDTHYVFLVSRTLSTVLSTIKGPAEVAHSDME